MKISRRHLNINKIFTVHHQQTYLYISSIWVRKVTFHDDEHDVWVAHTAYQQKSYFDECQMTRSVMKSYLILSEANIFVVQETGQIWLKGLA